MPIAAPRLPPLRLRTILLVVNLTVLAAPLGSIYFFRLYENELVHQSESELIAQGAYIAALYRQALIPRIQNQPAYGVPVMLPPREPDAIYTPVAPQLSLSQSEVLPPRPEAVAAQAPDNAALQAGHSIAPVLEEATLTTLAGVRLLDFRGVVVGGRKETGLSLAQVPEVQGALEGRYTSVLRRRYSDHPAPPLASISRSADIRVFTAMPVINDGRLIGVVLLSRSPRNILKGLYDERGSVAVALSLIVSITIALALLTSYAISRPVHALIAQTQRIARGEKDHAPICDPVTQELALLSQHIGSMADTIEQRSEYIRNFAMHVSHEFKTPLTAIQGAIELILEHGDSMPPEQLHKFLANIGNDTARLKILVSRLLELARADMTQPRTETCRLEEIFRLLQSDTQDTGPALGLRGEQGVLLPFPADILRTVLGSLLENSRQHGASTVTLSAEVSDTILRLCVEDNGQGISPSNAARLFTPFFTTRRNSGGTGLGLSIARALLAAYGAAILYEPAAQGARFVITVNTALKN